MVLCLLVFVFDETTDYAWVTDTLVLSAVRGITPVSELSEKNWAVYEEVCKFLTGFDYGASDYEKAKRIYEEITGRAVYHEGKYVQADDEVHSILVTGTGKCVGFARTYKLLANAVGLKCGFREDGAHMWNDYYGNRCYGVQAASFISGRMLPMFLLQKLLCLRH